MSGVGNYISLEAMLAIFYAKIQSMFDSGESIPPFTLPNYKWEERELLGRSHYGSTFKVSSTNKHTNQYVAIKQFQYFSHFSDYNRRFEEELEALKKIESKYVVRIFDSQLFERGGYIVSELCDYDLEKLLEIYQWEIPGEVANIVVKHIVEGISDLKRHNINNVFYSSNNFLVKNSRVKLSPVNFWKFNDSFEELASFSTPIYMAPEVIRQGTFIDNEKTHKGEVWSLGVIAYLLAVGSPPFTYQSWQSLQTNIQNLNVIMPTSVEINVHMRDFLEKCLVKDRYQRMNWDGIMKHPLITLTSNNSIPTKLSPEISSIWREIKMNCQKTEGSVLNEVKKEEQELSLQEFLQICRKYRKDMAEKEAISIFREYDTNNNNCLSYEELDIIFKKFRYGEENECVFLRNLAQAAKSMNINIYKISDYYDDNKSKTLDFHEMKALFLGLLPKSPESRIEKLWNHLHRKYKGKITNNDMVQELLLYLPTHTDQINHRAKAALAKFQESITTGGHKPFNLFNYFDTNQDKKLTLTEFIPMFNSLVGFEREEELKIIFTLIDKDQSGFISFKELVELWKTVE